MDVTFDLSRAISQGGVELEERSRSGKVEALSLLLKVKSKFEHVYDFLVERKLVHASLDGFLSLNRHSPEFRMKNGTCFFDSFPDVSYS